MDVYIKFINGKIEKTHSRFNIGDYVNIKDARYQYNAFTKAFKYFWGNEKVKYLSSENKEIWKIINIAAHPFYNCCLIYYIRNIKGENAIIGGDGLKKINYHKRNRENIKNIIVYEIPMFITKTHNWNDKLWDFYDNRKIIKK